MKTTLVFAILCGGALVYAMPPHHGGPHHHHQGGPSHHHQGGDVPHTHQGTTQKYVQSPIILSNTEWKPLTVIDNSQWKRAPVAISQSATPQPQKRASKPHQPSPQQGSPQQHRRDPRKIMPEKVMKDPHMADKMAVSLADTFIFAGPTAVPTYHAPVVRRKKDSPYHPANEIKIVSHNKVVSQKEDKAYHFDFESENGITRTEDGFIKAVPDSKYPAQVMSGSYSYTGPDGNVYTITYVADENGYRAEGSHLPVPVPPQY